MIHLELNIQSSKTNPIFFRSLNSVDTQVFCTVSLNTMINIQKSPLWFLTTKDKKRILWEISYSACHMNFAILLHKMTNVSNLFQLTLFQNFEWIIRKKLIERNLFYGKSILSMDFRNVLELFTTFFAPNSIVSPIKNSYILLT